MVVLATLSVVVILANVVLSIISSQSRLTQHQVGRIQAYYAALAGMNYAYEMLRRGPAAGGWIATSCPGLGCTLTLLDPQFAATFPPSILDVRIILIPVDEPGCNAATPVPPGITACIRSTATYLITPP